MSKAINAGDDVKRGDFFYVDPFKVIVKEENRGRAFPPTPEKIIEKALSMRDMGQIQPVVCRVVEDKKLMLDAGFTRTAAARLIRTGFDYKDENGEKQNYKDEDFKLKVVLQKGNDMDALLSNIAENRHRDDTSVIDDAHNQNRLRDRYGKSDTELAKLYRCAVSTIAQKSRLLGLSQKIQERVHYKGLSMSAALALLDLPEDQREAAVEAHVTENGHVDSAALNSMVRNRVLADSDADHKNGDGKSEKKKTRARSRVEVKKFFTTFAEETKSERRKNLVTTLMKWIEGRASDKSLQEILESL